MLRLPEPHLSRILEHCRDGYPEERCGAMLGRDAGGRREVVEVQALENIQSERARDRYEIHPKDLLALDARARERGLDVIGFYHSHPDHEARPSSYDTERAWQWYSYLIVSVVGGEATAWRSWVLEGEPPRFVEEPVAVSTENDRG